MKQLSIKTNKLNSGKKENQIDKLDLLSITWWFPFTFSRRI